MIFAKQLIFKRAGRRKRLSGSTDDLILERDLEKVFGQDIWQDSFCF